MVVDALRECNRIGSTIKHYEILSMQETLNVPALVFNITEYHFANIRSFGWKRLLSVYFFLLLVVLAKAKLGIL
jgi:hypothetical protein